MANNNIPPQAFTKEDLAKAYIWVQSQPDYVKNMATSKDTLVALYLQARRNGIASVENIAPVSSRDFKSQLQSLATELNQFEKEKLALIPSMPLNPPEASPHQMVSPIKKESFNERSIEFKVSEKTTVTEETLKLDDRSQQIIDSIKSQLNIESDMEIVRMLIALGYDKLKTILPNRQ